MWHYTKRNDWYSILLSCIGNFYHWLALDPIRVIQQHVYKWTNYNYYSKANILVLLFLPNMWQIISMKYSEVKSCLITKKWNNVDFIFILFIGSRPVAVPYNELHYDWLVSNIENNIEKSIHYYLLLAAELVWRKNGGILACCVDIEMAQIV